MVNCEECGKKLRFFEGYRHPVMGNKTLLCSVCFNSVSASVDRYRDFISPYNDFFNKENSNFKLLALKFISGKFMENIRIYDKTLAEKEI